MSYELRLGEIVTHARVDDSTLETGEGALPDANLVIETGPAFKALLAGEISPIEGSGTGASGSPAHPTCCIGSSRCSTFHQTVPASA